MTNKQDRGIFTELFSEFSIAVVETSLELVIWTVGVSPLASETISPYMVSTSALAKARVNESQNCIMRCCPAVSWSGKAVRLCSFRNSETPVFLDCRKRVTCGFKRVAASA